MFIVTVILVIFRYCYDTFMDLLLKRPLVDKLPARNVFITGCDSGFGKSLAKKLDLMGVRVFAGCLTEQGAAELAKESSERLATVRVDVTDTASIEAALDFVKCRLDSEDALWGVVNNAGYNTGSGPIEFENRLDMMRCLDVNAIGPAEVTRVFLPLLKKSQGRMVAIASVGGRIGFAEGSNYCMSKFALEGYLDSARRDLVNWGVSVHTLEPWFYKTAFVDPEASGELRRKKYYEQSQEVRDQYGDEWCDESVRDNIEFLKAVSLPDINEVVEAYVHALFSRYPKTRYVVGSPTRGALLRNMLPDFLSDLFFNGNTEPTPKALRKAYLQDISE